MHPNIVTEISRHNKGRHVILTVAHECVHIGKKRHWRPPNLRHSHSTDIPNKSRASGSYTSMFLQHYHLPFAYLVLPLNQFVSSGIAMSIIPHNSDSCLGSNIFFI